MYSSSFSLSSSKLSKLCPRKNSSFMLAEQLLCRAVVEAVPLSRHALDNPCLTQGGAVRLVLVLPPHIAAHDRVLAFGDLRQQHAEHLLLLGHVRVPGDRPRRYLAAAKVERRREVRLPPGLPELRDVSAHLLPRPVGSEVAPQHFLEGLPDDAPADGWPSLASIIIFIGGVQLLCLGIMGQYLAKTYLETRNRPLYIVRESNFDE